MASKGEYLMLPRAFSDKVVPDTEFADEAVVQCDFPVKKNTFYR